MIARSELNEENLRKVKMIEASAYSTNPGLIAMDYCEDWQAVASYLDCEPSDIRLFLSDSSYLLIVDREDCIEIADLASIDKHINIKQVIDIITGFDKPFIAYCRETTSYPILLYMERKEKIVCITDAEEVYEGETFHSIIGATKDVYNRLTPAEIELLCDENGREVEEDEVER